ncbi:hypothetical protein NVP1182O_06 [Vibrio phage 1.182.O._10N.286.46.E1]|nr:hypothetical protein NVP1182O_06 [Vibrio phage 1.182.O._10N.286.46.E1]
MITRSELGRISALDDEREKLSSLLVDLHAVDYTIGLYSMTSGAAPSGNNKIIRELLPEYSGSLKFTFAKEVERRILEIDAELETLISVEGAS